MGFTLSSKSLKKLEGVHPTLVELVKEVSLISPYEFTVISGVRSSISQYKLYLQGQTAVKGYYPTPCDGTKKRSSHQTSLKDGYGYAIDISLVGSNVSKFRLKEISEIFKSLANKKGISIRWGGDFKKKDPGHFDLKGGIKLVEGEETTLESTEELVKEEESPETVELEKKKLSQFQYYTISRDCTSIQNGICIGDSEAPLITFDKSFTLKNFLDTKFDFPEDDGTTPSNWERIQSTYILYEKTKYSKSNLLIKRGTKVVLPLSLLKKIDYGESTVNKTPETLNLISFLNQKGKELSNDPFFDERLRTSADNTNSESTAKAVASDIRAPFVTTETITVWIYSNIEKSLLNISSKISSFTLSNSSRGANFTLSLGGISFDNEIYRDSSGSVSISSIKNILDSEHNRNKTLPGLSKYFSNNDIVFIKVGEIDSKLKENLVIPTSEVGGKIYDFIGLLDSFQEVSDYRINDLTFTLSGRDFTKVLEDDEAKFFPLALTESLNGRMVLGTGGTSQKLLKRLFLGDYLTLFSKVDHTVGEIFQWYLSLLSNLGVLDEGSEKSLFSSYGDRIQYRDILKLQPQSGIYQIIKLIVDDSISNRRLVDSNVGSPDGNFIQLFNNLCMSPFIEWYTDTFGDMFNIVVRQPPFTQSLILKYIDSSNNFTHKNIKDKFLETVELEFTDQIYTWYQLFPKGNFWGVTNQIALDYLPVIQLDEYINKWGSKCYSVTSNYLELNTLVDSKSLERLEDFHRKSIDDLLTMISTTCYLPFTRKGRITLSVIDRSFRKNTFCYLEKTGEVFYIESVIHSGTITEKTLEGSTTLTVSRGMILDFIKGITIGSDFYSYFNIVDLELIKSVLYTNYDLTKDSNAVEKRGNKFVNKKVFDFFYNKEQFSYAEIR